MITSTNDEHGNIVLTIPAETAQKYAWALSIGQASLYNDTQNNYAEEMCLEEIAYAIYRSM